MVRSPTIVVVVAVVTTQGNGGWPSYVERKHELDCDSTATDSGLRKQT
jgi:hypothetical protein